MAEIYRRAKAMTKASKDGMIYSVDHIIPRRGKLVSGLHCPDNLRIVPMSYNRRKNNLFS
jgi:hypothetical protein